ncbi:GNAT family N-acetyltransferase [Streptomyces reniochalinae]|uniref:GNAT family N-acetyltransferase n=1 Tax=Streptomyces reniochalinae TaxID=2250578 RepID=A0A367EBS0_9ACTN|nr:GNAT family N-acetyltransferase [Streptomyces reniochalinae]RCG14680.1 GNAT family N-acetyltransferase [Streptomyces reniochalinae]
MPQLSEPATAVHLSFVAAMEEFAAEGRGAPEDGSAIARDLRRFGKSWQDPDVFAEYVAFVRSQATQETAAALRHRLNAMLLEYGGHIGYDVRRTARRRGYATAMLRAALPRAAALGVERALVTCDHDNVASRRVIEACGGVFEVRRGVKLRYWIATPAAEPAASSPPSSPA